MNTVSPQQQSVQLVLCDILTHSLTHSLTDTQTDFIICPMPLTHWADN